MIRAILEGRKTQTRRVVKFDASSGYIVEPGGRRRWHRDDPAAFAGSPYGLLGDALWVRETFLPRGAGAAWIYRADLSPVDAAGIAGMYSDRGWKPGIHMPRAASRLSLRITDVRVQRLQEISEEDARAEGVGLSEACTVTGHKGDVYTVSTYRSGLAEVWDSINGKRAPWASNPWVWCVSFERIGATP